jgi:N,N'-diacetyllegionaminate synthase
VQAGGTLIIAEAGVNHNGSIDTALKMVDVAADAGADAVKFQTFSAEKLVTRNAAMADYQTKNTGGSGTQFEMLGRLELNAGAHKKLMLRCGQKGIKFLSTPFDLASIDLLNELGLDTFKIPSGEITNLPYLRKIGGLGKKVILSSGMSDMGEIEDALEILTLAGTPRDDITVLHCTTEYPAPLEDVNLRAMLAIGDAFKVKVGYSDHTTGIVVSVAAVALGASVIEKHFTLDRNMEGPDHKASLEPDELKALVAAIRNVEKALGDGVKRPSRSEAKNVATARKSIVAARDIKAGERFSEGNITVKRPAGGINPMLWDGVLGQKAKRDFKRDDPVEF